MEEDLSSSRHGGAAVSQKIQPVAAGSAPLAARPLDYAELLGGFAHSCSLPLLHLPPVIDDLDAAQIDYSEIFGDFDGENFASTYEELVADLKKATKKTNSARERFQKETCFDMEVNEDSKLPTEVPNKNHIASIGDEETQILGNPLYELEQCGMLYHKASQVNEVDNLNRKLYVNQPHCSSGLFLMDSCSSQKVELNPPTIIVDDHKHSQDFNMEILVEKKEKKFSSVSSTDGATGLKNDLRDDQNQGTTESSSSENRPANVSNQLWSSSNHSNGDASYPALVFLSASDINLKTQPMEVPPPLRPPPKIVSQKKPLESNVCTNPKTDLDGGFFSRSHESHQGHNGRSANENYAVQDAEKESSHFSFALDVSSAAVASAASMKDVTEEAQVRLNSARESMERKQGDIQNSNKHGCHKTMYKRQEPKVEGFNQEMTPKMLLCEDREVTKVTLEEKGGEKAPGVFSEVEEMETNIKCTEKSVFRHEGKETSLSQPSHKLDKRNVQWKEDELFHELMSNNKKFKTLHGMSEPEGIEKELVASIKIHQDKEHEHEVPYKLKTVQAVSKQEGFLEKLEEVTDYDKESSFKVETMVQESKRRLSMFTEFCECKEKNSKNKVSIIMVDMEEEIKEISNATAENHVQEKDNNKIEKFPDIYIPVKIGNNMEHALNINKQHIFDKKTELDEVHSFVEKKKSNAAEKAIASEVIVKKSRIFNGAYVLKGAYKCKEEENELVAHGGDHRNFEKKFNAPIVSSESDKEKGMKPDKSVIEADNDYEACLPSRSSSCKVGQEMVAAQETSQTEEHEKKIGSYYHEVNKHELQQNNVRFDHEERRNLDGPQEIDNWVSNEKIKSTVEDFDSDVNEKIPKATEESNIITENKINLEAMTEVHERDHIKKKIWETQTYPEQNGRKEKEAQMSCETENHDNMSNEGWHGHKIFPKNKCSEASQQAMFEEKRNITSPDLNAKDDCLPRSTNNNTADIQIEDVVGYKGRIDRESRQGQDLAQKLKEEKEREREREKDRLGVERGTHEARERIQEMAESIALERVIAEARQRALAAACKKSERATSEASEKSLAEKAPKGSRLKAEHAAVEQATAEARECAAAKAASEARACAERSTSMSKDRMMKSNEKGELCTGKATDKEDKEMTPKSSTSSDDIPYASNAKVQGTYQRCSSPHYHASPSDGKSEGRVGESALRCKARLDRHQRATARAEKALAEMKTHDLLAQRELAEKNRLAESLDVDVRRWSTGKEGNLRALLSTLQYILGPESGWQPIPLTEIITAAAIKKAYRKATLFVHPDKLQQRGATIQQKYTCEKVFDLLKDAWNRFNSEEQ